MISGWVLPVLVPLTLVAGMYIGLPFTKSQARFWYNAGWNDALRALEPADSDVADSDVEVTP
jgi:hypothetical protein